MDLPFVLKGFFFEKVNGSTGQRVTFAFHYIIYAPASHHTAPKGAFCFAGSAAESNSAPFAALHVNGVCRWTRSCCWRPLDYEYRVCMLVCLEVRNVCLSVHCVFIVRRMNVCVYIVYMAVLQTTCFLHTAHFVFCRRHTLCTRCTACYISVGFWL